MTTSSLDDTDVKSSPWRIQRRTRRASHLRGGGDHVKCCAELKPAGVRQDKQGKADRESQTEEKMAWTTPVIVEVCVGMEITSYESAEI